MHIIRRIGGSTGSRIGGLVLILFVTVPLWIQNPYYLNFFIVLWTMTQLALAWNWIGGYCDMVSLGHAVFFALGAYGPAVAQLHWGWHPLAGLLLGLVAASLVAVLIGVPTLRLRGHYFAIATIAVAEALRILFENWPFVGGARGLEWSLTSVSILTDPRVAKSFFYYSGLVMVLFTMGATRWMDRHALGYFLRAIRNDEQVAASIGIPVAHYRMIAFVTSAALSALAGSYYFFYYRFIEPRAVMGLELSVLMALMVILGGRGTILGPVVGAFILTPLSEFLRALFGGHARGIDLVIYGFLIMVLTVVEPRGLLYLVRRHEATAGPTGVEPVQGEGTE